MGSTGSVFNITEIRYIFHDVFSLHVTTTSLLGGGHIVDPTNNKDVHKISPGSFSVTVKRKSFYSWTGLWQILHNKEHYYWYPVEYLSRRIR